MTTPSPDVFLVQPGDKIRITLNSVNFANNAKFDPKLELKSQTNFEEVAEIEMGNSHCAFAVAYGFPSPLPGGAKYTETITGPDGFIDGPNDIVPQVGQTLIVRPYVLQLQPPPAALALGGGK
jgi:hypothetical protein